MDCALARRPLSEVEADAVIGFLATTDDGSLGSIEPWDGLTDGLCSELVERKEFSGKSQSLAVIHRPPGLRADRLVLAGCGDGDGLDILPLREAAGAAWRRLRTSGVRTVAVVPPEGIGENEAVRAIVEGIVLADYEPDLHKSADRKESKLSSILVLASSSAEGALDRAVATATAQNTARELANEPGNLLPPQVLAARAEALAAKAGLDCEVLDRDDLESLGMGALLGVARGSKEPPVMIVLRYRPDLAADGVPHLGLVGKAVTFDTGGISIKPSANMHLMKGDMAGGAAMLGAMLAIAAIRPSTPVTAVIPSVENMPGGDAQRPGDIVTTRSGLTVEVLNTDAEGRLILADALTYAKERGCTHLVDAATLTGAIVVALGHDVAGVFANDNEWGDKLLRSARLGGDRMWSMPLGEVFSKQLESPVADLANIGTRWGGAVTAAAFLERFAEGVPWVHLDIAGTSWYEKPKPHAPVGPTGAPVPTLVDLALSMGQGGGATES